jgi:hypothetical protein
VTVRCKAAQSFAFVCPAAQGGHIRLDPGFIDKDQLTWIEVGLEGAPSLSSSCDIGARLLKSE